MEEKKFRTINDLSALEAARMFDNASQFDSFFDSFEHSFPTDISARDFFECLSLYCKGVPYPTVPSIPLVTTSGLSWEDLKRANLSDQECRVLLDLQDLQSRFPLLSITNEQLAIYQTAKAESEVAKGESRTAKDEGVTRVNPDTVKTHRQNGVKKLYGARPLENKIQSK
jgi:hypothetical protein